MFIAFGGAEVLGAADDAGADEAAGADEVAGGALLLELLQAASPRAAAATATTAALRPRDRVAGKEGTVKLLCARSLGGGLANSPVGRVPARLTGFFDGVSSLHASAPSGTRRLVPSLRPPL